MSRLPKENLMDTSPIAFSIGDVAYRMPRNFLVGMANWSGGPQESVDIKVTYPALAPFNEQTKDCFLREEHCKTIQLTLLPRNVRAADEYFEGSRKNFESSLPKIQDGFEVFDVGPQVARRQYFRKVLSDRTLYFWCNSDDLVSGRKVYGVCQSYTRTRAGTIIRYRFSRRDIPAAVAMDSSLRDLIDSFVIGPK